MYSSKLSTMHGFSLASCHYRVERELANGIVNENHIGSAEDLGQHGEPFPLGTGARSEFVTQPSGCSA
jgi:hypothetical protein